VQSFSELAELYRSRSERQLATMAEQSKKLASSAQKIATDATRSLTGMFGGERLISGLFGVS
jgi:hypothetical protein